MYFFKFYVHYSKIIIINTVIYFIKKQNLINKKYNEKSIILYLNNDKFLHFQ